MRAKELPAWLPAKVTISLADVVETHRVFQKEKFLRIYDQTDPYDCPFVRALRRTIPEEFWLNIWMLDDYIVHLQSPEGHEFKAALSKADRERLSQYDRHEISPANRTIKLTWEEEFA
jgi:hypothetical protein